jgi:8-oxo-dGTP pyrophosphatase MutT (NUDIX family)
MDLSETVACYLLTLFYVNLPTSEQSDVNRRFYHLEQAYWFYLDLLSGWPQHTIASKANSTFHFIQFASQLLKFAFELDTKCSCSHFDTASLTVEYEKYLSRYKYKIPVAGCILLSLKNSKWFVVMVKGVGNHNFGFPKGKINKDESFEDAAARETFEEVGFPVPPLEKGALNWNLGHARLFPLALKIPFDYPFKPKTRGEIELVSWVPVVPLQELGEMGIRVTRLSAAIWPNIIKFVEQRL